ncbi:MAG: Flp pilus assembly complex ATPase component TadA [Planctomycetaceae bacterium]|jgi:general secretion pathway protein E|nr:Flp pilus assembly complex ATPase component TadA [Planctomycetaceae bacterium]
MSDVLLSESDLKLQVLAESLGLEFLHGIGERPPSAAFIRKIPIRFARQHCLLGLADDDNILPVLIGKTESYPLLDIVSRFLNRPVRPIFARSSHIFAAINTAYQQQESQTQDLVETFDRESVLADIEKIAPREDLLDTQGRAPVIRLVNLIFFDAVKARASDIHIQPSEEELVVRFRIDGVLFDTFRLPKKLQDEVVSRIKIIGRMNIAEKRLPQDGRATVQMGDRLIDLRIASLPSSHGERVVLRLLDKSARLYTLDQLGMDKENLQKFRDLVHLEHGLILVTGPTGSGKSTTLYAALQAINTVDWNALTLEDPIEYQLEGISQTQINEKKGLTFARGLRNILRQDPDIIMVGEIRDQETAIMAIQAALTGHMVFSTLHTNDAAGAITRLLDLGIEPYLVASSLIAVLAQRLVRKNCPQCSVSYEPGDELLRIGLPVDTSGTYKKGAGCEFCRQSGYHERIGLFELLTVEPSIRKLIQDRANATTIREEASKLGMQLLRDDGIGKVLSGRTTIDEVARIASRAVVE